MEKNNFFKFIFTSQSNCGEIALNEIFKIFKNAKFCGWINSGVGIVQVDYNFRDISNKLKKEQVIFIRHICPIDVEVEINGECSDINILKSTMKDLIHLLDFNKSASIQTRIISSKKIFTYKKFDINQALSNELENLGLEINVKKPEQIVSIILKDNKALIGISLASENLSDWSGGEHRFLRLENQISRAEFKLLEVLDVFNIDLSKYKSALDLGAAPGGWTHVLLENNLNVTAVDPAELHPSIKFNKNVIHFKGLAQEFLKKNNFFDVIVNDMRMDTKESCLLMGLASNYLNKDGIAIMTLKLPKKGMQKLTSNSLKILKQWYNILYVRQLFHNRSEVTVVLKLKN
ncbi:SAM-dependent methyltransferase [Clostridium perfringens]|uniref:SAM-dependent methyltransferase n=1 Tax=Clostridium perfringens TaxID=1502 RepID=UPI0010390924|nr:SAM-dependent methyltransferase [Clostridium perfringens]TBX05624.1 hypothetical protein BFS03_13480 [Clostridium perfringens]